MNLPPEPGTVFIVDDDASFLRSISRLLRASGCLVQAFESADEFLQQLAPGMSGCVLADLQMPGLNGLELQAALAKSANPLPVVFLSARGDIPTTVQAMRRGAEDFLTKLSPKEQLLDAVRRALARGAQERSERVRLQQLREVRCADAARIGGAGTRGARTAEQIDRRRAADQRAHGEAASDQPDKKIAGAISGGTDSNGRGGRPVQAQQGDLIFPPAKIQRDKSNFQFRGAHPHFPKGQVVRQSRERYAPYQ